MEWPEGAAELAALLLLTPKPSTGLSTQLFHTLGSWICGVTKEGGRPEGLVLLLAVLGPPPLSSPPGLAQLESEPPR